MDLTNERYVIVLRGKTWSERYYRKGPTWVKESSKGNLFPATAEQVLNHLLPALARLKPGIEVDVEYRAADGPGVGRGD